LPPLDAHRRWYRCHHLFADLLRARLHREHPGLAPALHCAAAAWWLAAGDGDAAMHHARQCYDADFAAEMAQQFGVQMVGGSRLGAFLSWLTALNADAVAQRPYLLVGAAWAQVLTRRSDLALQSTDLAETALDNFTSFASVVDRRAITAAEVSGHINAMRGDIDSVIAFSRRTLEELPRDAYTVRSTVALNLGLLEMERGELDAVLHTCEDAYQMGIQNAANLLVVLSTVGLKGEIYLQRGQLRDATAEFQALLTLGTGAAPTPPAVGMGYLGLARIALLQGNAADARRLLNDGMRLAAEIVSSEARREAGCCWRKTALPTPLICSPTHSSRRSSCVPGSRRDSDALVHPRPLHPGQSGRSDARHVRGAGTGCAAESRRAAAGGAQRAGCAASTGHRRRRRMGRLCRACAAAAVTASRRRQYRFLAVA